MNTPTPPRSTFQHQRQVEREAKTIAVLQFTAGERVGYMRGLALGLGFSGAAFGLGFIAGVVVVITAAGFFN